MEIINDPQKNILTPPLKDAIEILDDYNWHGVQLAPDRIRFTANDDSIVLSVREHQGDLLSKDTDPLQPTENIQTIIVKMVPNSWKREGNDFLFEGTAKIGEREIQVFFLGTNAGFFLQAKIDEKTPPPISPVTLEEIEEDIPF